jgi:hypothetical protein
MKEESRRKVLDNTVLRKTFEPIREEITGGRKYEYLYSEVLPGLYSSPRIIRLIK